MNSDPFNRPCIEMKPSFRPSTELTVAEYEERFQAIKLAGTEDRPPRAWVPHAPPVEKLLPDSYEGVGGWVRVVDPEAYNQQMRQLLGLV